jgi:RNA polymerase II subunit A small phosphatase-like protein
MNNAFVKDLSKLGRQMTDVIIVDNSPIAYMLQPENALPIISWYEDMTDRELPRLA